MLNNFQNNHKTFIIAIDGASATGKGTIAKKIAQKLGFDYLDTGSLYRIVAYLALQENLTITQTEQIIAISKTIEEHITGSLADSKEIRSDEVSLMSSDVSKIADVRANLLKYQQDFANYPESLKGAVLDGRDIGTVVCPNADFKLFITADVKIRAQRRYKELQEKGFCIIYEKVLEDLEKRDHNDTNRSVAPLRPADDAFILDTSDLNAEQAYLIALDEICKKLQIKY